MPGINYVISATATKFNHAVADATARIAGLGKDACTAGAAGGQAFGGLGAAALRFAAAAGAASAAVGFLKMGVAEAMRFETALVQLKVLTGSVDAAKKAISAWQDLAGKTPLQEEEIIAAGRSLLAFGYSAEESTDALRRMGDISTGVGMPLTELASIVGKARVQGRLFGEDINQLTGRGIPVLDALAKQFGVGAEEVKKLVEQGKVGFPQLDKALKQMTDAGGKFSGMMAEMSNTAEGKLSSLADAWKKLAATMATPIVPVVKVATDYASAGIWAIQGGDGWDVDNTEAGAAKTVEVRTKKYQREKAEALAATNTDDARWEAMHKRMADAMAAVTPEQRQQEADRYAAAQRSMAVPADPLGMLRDKAAASSAKLARQEKANALFERPKLEAEATKLEDALAKQTVAMDDARARWQTLSDAVKEVTLTARTLGRTDLRATEKRAGEVGREVAEMERDLAAADAEAGQTRRNQIKMERAARNEARAGRRAQRALDWLKKNPGEDDGRAPRPLLGKKDLDRARKLLNAPQKPADERDKIEAAILEGNDHLNEIKERLKELATA